MFIGPLPPKENKMADMESKLEAFLLLLLLLLLHHQNGSMARRVANEQQEVIKLFTVATTIATTVLIVKLLRQWRTLLHCNYTHAPYRSTVIVLALQLALLQLSSCSFAHLIAYITDMVVLLSM